MDDIRAFRGRRLQFHLVCARFVILRLGKPTTPHKQKGLVAVRAVGCCAISQRRFARRTAR